MKQIMIKGHETIEIVCVDDDDEDINNPMTKFYTLSSDEPRMRFQIDILAGPFTIEKLYKLYTK
jgi:hypothetical protein